MKHLDLFSGIGGFSLAASWVWGPAHEITSFVEIDLDCQEVLRKHWPDVPIHNDIRNYIYDGTAIDLLTGGFPCQPFSCAGKRRGTKDDRYLWPQMLRVIQEIRPAWILAENVAGLKSMAELEMLPDLESGIGLTLPEGTIRVVEGPGYLRKILEEIESCGYTVQPFIIPACAVDAPHRRNRVWIVAKSTFDGWGKVGPRESAAPSQTDVAYATRKRPREAGQYIRRSTERAPGCGQDIPNPFGRSGEARGDSTGREAGPDADRRRKRSTVADAPSVRRKQCAEWQCGIPEKKGGLQEFVARSEWLPEPSVGRVANGVPRRVDRLRALGNAIVPQVVVPVMQAIKQIETVLKYHFKINSAKD